MGFSDEEIKNLKDHLDDYIHTNEDLEPRDDYENLEVRSNSGDEDSIEYEIAWGGERITCSIRNRHPNFAETMLDLVDGLSLEESINQNYSSNTGRCEIKALELDIITDENGYLVDQLVDEVDRLAHELHPEN